MGENRNTDRHLCLISKLTQMSRNGISFIESERAIFIIVINIYSFRVEDKQIQEPYIFELNTSPPPQF